MYSQGVKGAGAEFVNGNSRDCLQPTLLRFSKFLGNRQRFASNRGATVADFVMYEYIDCACLYYVGVKRAEAGVRATFYVDEDLKMECLEATPNLRQFCDR